MSTDTLPLLSSETSPAPVAVPHRKEDHELRHRLTVVCIGVVFLSASGFLRWLRPDQPEIASLTAMLGATVVAIPIMIDALKALKSTGFAATKFYMDQYITLAVAACFAAGQYVTAGIVAVILILGQVLEERSVMGVREAIESLTKLSRVRARRVRNGAEELVDAEVLLVGDRVRLHPGDTVPADARVVSGTSTINQASITGESLPVEVAEGGDVFAGTSNLTGALEIEVTKTGTSTVLGRVQEIIAEAEGSRAPIMRIAEEYARYYTPLVLIIAAFVLFFTRDINRAISVIIVSIPCAFVLASPSAMVAALAAASRLGILVKSARFFEAANEIDAVVFDKTGTLTKGELRVAEISALEGYSEDQVLALAASVEQRSTHPVAQAVVRAARERSLTLREATDLHEQPGHGLSATFEGHKVVIGRAKWLIDNGIPVESPGGETPNNLSVLLLACDGILIGRLHLTDTVRPEARSAVTTLQALGAERIVMLTGDRKAAALHMGGEVGVNEIHAECLPEDKLTRVEALKAEGYHVLVVGDGINDAPALAAGDLGVAMGALGSDVAVKTADVALMSSDLRRLPALLQLSRNTVSIINQNMLCGFLFIVIAIVVSSLGLVSPILAAFIHEFSAFFVIFNSARLLRFTGEEGRQV